LIVTQNPQNPDEVELLDEATPLAALPEEVAPEEEEVLFDLPETKIPLGSAPSGTPPRTGDSTGALALSSLLSAAGLLRRKRRYRTKH